MTQDILDILEQIEPEEENASKLIRINGQIEQDARTLINNLKDNLEGQFDLYCIYQDQNRHMTYGLVYVDYQCGMNIKNEEDFLTYYSNDALLLAKKLKDSEIKLDYFFIMPYFTNEIGQSILYNSHIILTHEF
jgi:hypothetical protein